MRPTWTTRAVLLAAALTTAPAWAEEGSSEEAVPSEGAPRTGWSVQGLPLLNFNDEMGFGYGARVLLVDAGDGSQKPYRYSVMASFFQRTEGAFDHGLVLDAPGFLSSPWRLGAQLRMARDPFATYFGLGGESTYEQGRNKGYYHFDQYTFPSVVLNARRSVRGPLQMALGYRLRFTEASTRVRSRLVEDARKGLLIGLENPGWKDTFRTAEVTASLLLDTRDNEPAPVRGMFHEFAVRAAHTATGSSFDYWGATTNLRFYRPVLSERLVAALRLMVDVMDGEVPFFLLSSFGSGEGQGIGGAFTARGIRRNFVQGEVKALANAELRWRFLSISPLRQRVDFTLVGFLDAGNAWADLRLADAGLFRYAAGGGLRMAWEKYFILRLDYGVSPQDGKPLFYMEFNHLF